MNKQPAEQRTPAACPKRIMLWSTGAMALFELITLASRFGLGMQSTRDTQFLAAYTFGFRIHHGYFGVLGLLIAWVLPRGRVRFFVLVIALGLIGSDLIHHYAVLWPLTGSPQFDIRYK